MKVARLIHCLMSIVRLVAAITIRSIRDGDNNIVTIRLEVSGVIFLSRGHYTTIQVNLLFLVGSTCFGGCFRPSSGALDCIHSFW